MKTDKSILWLFLLLILVIFMGTLGFFFVEEGWSLVESFYMTIITLTTIGFGEVHPLSDTGRIFTVILIVFGIGIAASFISRVGQIIIEAGLNHSRWRKKMERKVSKMKDHFILCGYGRIGRSIAENLFEADVSFVVIESDDSKTTMLQGTSFPIILGDCTKDATLLSAGIERARGTVLCVNDDATNVNIALAARQLNPQQQIITRGSDPEVEYRLIRAGADIVVYPLRLGGEQIARLMTEQVNQEDVGTPSLFGYELKIYKNYDDSRIVSDLLNEKDAVRPVAVKHLDGTMTHNIKPDFEVLNGESLLLLVNSEKSTKELHITHLEWTDELSLGIAQIDDEHRMLFQYAKDFQNAVLKGLSTVKIRKTLEHLVRYTQTHFAQEEVLMKQAGYPDISEHHELHVKLTEKVVALYKVKNKVYSVEIWDFLEQWLKEHILGADKKLAHFIDSKDHP